MCLKCCRRINRRARKAKCSVCSKLVHASCDPMLTDGVLKVLTAYPTSCIRYICVSCQPMISNLQTMQTSEQDSLSTIAMLDSAVSYKTVRSSSPIENKSINRVNMDGVFYQSSGSHNDLIQRLNNIESQLQVIMKALQTSSNADVPDRKYVPCEQMPYTINRSVLHSASVATCTNPKNKPLNKSKHVDCVHKPIETKPSMRNKRDDLTVICTNVSEPTATSLKSRYDEDLQNWQLICQTLGIDVKPVGLTRLFRHRSSPHSGEPRLLRVTLKNMEDVETVLLSSHLLRKASLPIRVFPDIPWDQRQKTARDPMAAKISRNKTTVLIHGVPESPADNEWSKQEHDCQEWRFIQQLLGTENILTTGICRLPHSNNYKGTGPRVLKVTLLNASMVDTLLTTWNSHKRLLPPELKIRTFPEISRIENVSTQKPRAVTNFSLPASSISALSVLPTNDSKNEDCLPLLGID